MAVLYHQQITTYLCQLVQSRGIPLHRLASASGIGEDVLLDIFAQRRLPSPRMLHALTQALREDGSAATSGVPPTLVQRLKQLSDIDDDLLSQIARFARDHERAPEESVDPDWAAAVVELANAYAGYHGELTRVLRSLSPRGSDGGAGG